MREALTEETDGWKDLIAWLRAEVPPGSPKRTAAWLARELNVSGPAVRQWIERIARPAGAKRDALCRITGSSPERWITSKEKVEAEKLAGIGRSNDDGMKGVA